MKVFIWFIVIWSILDTLAKLYFMVLGKLPARTMGGAAIDVIFTVGLIVWGFVLLLT